MKKRVAVVGSREYGDMGLVRKFVRNLARTQPEAIVVSGGARGVDRTAEEEARACGLEVVSIRADWDTYGKRAGFLRNGTIVERSDVVVAFWDGESRGTIDTATKAAEAGKGLVVYGPSGRMRGGLKGMKLHLLDTQRVQGCTKCPLAKTRTNTVFGEGDPDARLAFVGEAPGRDEDAQGRPFVGRAGKLLDKMIGAMGLKREDVWICNTLKCRPPNNRTPEESEIRACSPYLGEQLGIIGPDVVVALGAPAAQTILGTDERIGRLRGRFHDFRISGTERTIPLMPTYHPAYLLRSPGEQPKVADDLKMVMERLGLCGPLSQR